jgi:V-type H+-transporting ATPase subunit D
MGRVMQLAAFSLAEVTYATGDISYMIQESVTEANFRVKAKQENVSGTILPAFEAVRSEGGEGNGNGNGSAFEAFLSLLLRHLPRSGTD